MKFHQERAAITTLSQLTISQRRRGLSFAKEVEALAQKAPDAFTKRLVYSAARSIQKQYGFSDDAKKQYILKLLAIGCSSAQGLANESDMPKQEINRLLVELADEQKVRITPIGGPWQGRPAQFIELVAV